MLQGPYPNLAIDSSTDHVLIIDNLNHVNNRRLIDEYLANKTYAGEQKEHKPIAEADKNPLLVTQKLNCKDLAPWHLHDQVDPWVFPQRMVEVLEVAEREVFLLREIVEAEVWQVLNLRVIEDAGAELRAEVQKVYRVIAQGLLDELQVLDEH